MVASRITLSDGVPVGAKPTFQVAKGSIGIGLTPDAGITVAPGNDFASTPLPIENASTVTLFASANKAVTIYPQFSPDGTNWFNAKVKPDTDWTCALATNEKNCWHFKHRASYFRITAKAVASCTLKVQVVVGA